MNTFISAVLFTALVAVASGSAPSEIDAIRGMGKGNTKSHTKNLLQLLVELMGELDEDDKNAKVSANRDCSLGSISTITPIELNNLLDMDNNSQPYYIVLNGGETLKGETELQLYYRLISRVHTRIRRGDRITDLWMSIMPSSASMISLLSRAFYQVRKPEIHIKALGYPDTTLDGNMKNLGCLAELRANYFYLSGWNWEDFIRENRVTNSVCKRAIRMLTSDRTYSQERELLNKLISAIGTLHGTNEVDELCPISST